jgi:mannose-6-phosphate isomerase-like protein (cupin superfamily)
MTKEIRDSVSRVRMSFTKTGENLVVDCRVEPGGGLPPHYHPRQEERWSVVEGRVGFRLGDSERVIGPSDGEIVVEPGGGLPPHYHPRQEERWSVVEGRVGFRLGDSERVIGPSDGRSWSSRARSTRSRASATARRICLADGALRLEGRTTVARQAVGLAWNKLGMIRGDTTLHAQLTLRPRQ